MSDVLLRNDEEQSDNSADEEMIDINLIFSLLEAYFICKTF